MENKKSGGKSESKSDSKSDRIKYAIEQFEANNIEFSLKSNITGHFHCRRKSDDRLFQFWATTGKIMGYKDLRGVHSLIELLN